MEFNQLKKNLKKDFTGLKKIKVSLLSDTASQLLVQSIRGYGYEYGYDLNIFEADFNQIDRQIMDYSSELYEHEADITIIYESSHKLLNKFNKLPAEKKKDFAENHIEHLDILINTLSAKLKTKIIYLNLAEINDTVYGNYANKQNNSFVFQQRKFNYLLMEKAVETPELFICDLSAIQSLYGKQQLFSPSIYINTEMVLSIEILPKVANGILSIIAAMSGRMNKCIILDLDNTTWGGIIGDDGLENIQLGTLGIGKAFTELQYWVKSLQQRGIIIAVCSKNTESVAKEPFEKHPDMVLRLEDIAVFVANWENKADNIRQIQSVLNIGFDSMVFLDDNPFERNIVRDNIPGICVPELPQDPAEYLQYLYSLNLFETISVSNEDAERTKLYQTESKRVIQQQQFTNEDDFLKDLNMLSIVESFNKFNTPRVAQLSQRSNQFNLRTVRYTDADIEALATAEDFHTISFTLEDKFGDNGLICVIILKKENDTTLFIDTWFMSCRVLKRGMENFVLNTIANFANENGFSIVKGEYIPTAKNEMVKDHYKNLGFEDSGNFWTINAKEYINKKCFINKK